ncbi:ABC-type multidrug transport system, ATPase component [Streptomyces sp. 2323.1]|uniref:ABC transporter ATP-binding protein n=1 Tax=Streptomyces sp. 2323.1 TaxID=1938841 RepID=UPI000BBF50F8|nr:ABC transporter ATP-binding protein [Streptomyces sp. 2323.1]SOE10441.1 ABC-type multidrug transport system, ATPase component [Streptomyces sp. 2323.1]
MRLDGVGRRYGVRGPWVLREVQLDVPVSALLRIEGTNGSGKSTLLRLLAGIDRPSTGRITGRRRSAYVPERFPVALPFTAVGYLTHLGRIHGLRGPEAARRATEWLERFGAAGHARTPMAELSKGTSQKVAVAQALLAEPGLLVLDEAWTGLDRSAREVLDRAVAERVADGGTVVFVDHDPRRLAGAADARYRVEDGRLLAQDAHASTAGPVTVTGPRVTIEAEGAPGSVLSAGPDRASAGAPQLPAGTEISPGPDGTTLLTVPAVHSDVVLRALLTANPPWHIRAVTAAVGPDDGTDDGTGPGTATGGTAASGTTAPGADDHPAPAPDEAPLP